MASKRHITKFIRKRLKEYPIVVLTGPRQSGKTTLLKNEFPKWEYVNLESPDVQGYATEDPKSFLEEYNGKIIIDEVQRVPSLFSYLQVKVDESGTMGQYILSGSQNFNLMQSISQSLAGRVALLTLLPYDFTEMRKARIWSDDVKEHILTGSYPAIYDRDVAPHNYYKNYLSTYVKRDITQLVNIQNLTLFNKFLKLCAGRVGQLLNYNDLAKDTGISHSTARSWLSLLETSYIIFLLPPYHQSYNKRIIKSPKLYFYDTGLVSHLLNLKKIEQLRNHNSFGHIFENLVVAEKLKRNFHNDESGELYFWRDSHGNEVDLIEIEDNMKVFEIKSSSTLTSDTLKGLRYFDTLSGGDAEIFLIYGGDKAQKRQNIQILPWFE